MKKQSITRDSKKEKDFIIMLKGWRAAITVGTNNSPLTGLSNRY